MFGISGTELFLILLFGFLIFGPDKLPEIAKTIGRGIAKFKSAQEDMNSTLQGQIFDPNSDKPFKDPVQALDKLAQKAEEKDQKPASGAAAGAAAPATQQRATGAGNAVRQESFTERKARYERERAARRAEEERRAKEAAAAPAAGASAAQPSASTASAQPAAAATATQPAASTASASAAPAAGTQSAPGSDAAAATSERGE